MDHTKESPHQVIVPDRTLVEKGLTVVVTVRGPVGRFPSLGIGNTLMTKVSRGLRVVRRRESPPRHSHRHRHIYLTPFPLPIPLPLFLHLE